MHTFKQVTYYEVGYRELEKIIQDHFGIEEFSIIASEELSNDMAWTALVTAQEPDEYDKKKLDAWLAKPQDCFMWGVTILLDHLAIKGVIPAGDYCVDICW